MNTHDYARRNLYLIQFAHRHPDFQHAELVSVMEMHKFSLKLLNADNDNGSSNQRIHCDKHISSKEEDDVNVVWTHPLPNEKIARENNRVRPFLILSFHASVPESRISECISECVLVKSVLELWSADVDMQQCAAKLKATLFSPIDNSPSKLIRCHCMDENKSWKITTQTFGSKYSKEEQDAMRAIFNFLPFSGPVNLDNPLNEFLLIREIEVNDLGSPIYPRHDHKRRIIAENDSRPPLGVYFVRVCCGGSQSLRQGKVEKYSLKSRRYLGPTSMDSELSMIMTNLGQVKQGTFCFDPFVGTGSILVTCALKGAYCFGTDIDIRVLKGRSDEENIFSNFDQYSLPRPELVRSDNSLYDRHYRTSNAIYDVICCDPPYGVRAGARKCGSKKDKVREILPEHRYDHVAQTRPYAVSNVMEDLLDVAARSLVMEGRLVYIIPSMLDFDPKSDLPMHPCLQFVSSCYQPLSSQYGRRVVTMQKIGNYEVEKREEYMNACWLNGPESANKCANIREKLIELARADPDKQRKAEYRKKKRKARQAELKKAKLLAQEKTENES